MGFQTRELDESGRVLPPDRDEYRAWFAEAAPPGVTPDDHGVDWNSWLARPWHTEEYLHPTAWTMGRSIRFLEDRDDDRPFFLNISFARPHSPYVPPAPYFEMYLRGETPEPAVGDWAAVHDVPEEAVNPNAWRGRLTPERIHRARAGYYGECSFIDTQIGRLTNWMHRHRPRVLANTWFVVTSDHGDMQGDHNLWRKTYAYEGSTRIPFLVAPPAPHGRPAQSVAEKVVELRDVMPTVLEIAGVDLPPTVCGRSVLPLMDEAGADWRDYIHGEHCTCYAPEQEMQYVTDGRRKFIWLPRTGEEQFFDLEADPGERRNVVDETGYRSEVARWRGRLVAELTARDCGWVVDGRLTCPSDAPLVSRWRDVRWPGQT
jgi:arylsulfatase A-like enzyme